MPTSYFVSQSGSDANDGLSPDATTANTHKPWLTLHKALQTGTPVVAGDTIYVGPGVLYEGGTYIVVIAAVSSVGSPLLVTGDPQNAQGFKDGSGVLLSPSLCWVTTRASGTDDSPPTGAGLFDLSTNNVLGLRFSNLCFENNLTADEIFRLTLAGNDNLTVTDCRLIARDGIFVPNTVPTAGRGWRFRRCLFISRNGLFAGAVLSAAATANANLDILFESCLYFGPMADSLALGTSAGNKAGGITWRGCTCLVVSGRGLPAAQVDIPALQSVALLCSTVTPMHVDGCLVIGGQGVNAGTLGHFTDDGYNRFACNAASVNFTLAGTSLAGAFLDLVLPDTFKFGLDLPRPDLLGWRDSADTLVRASGRTDAGVDFRNRLARPWGGGPSIGCFETLAVVQDTGSALTGGGVNSAKLTGAGELSFFVPVDAVTTTISVRTKSTTYGGTNYPQLIVMPNAAIGVTQQTASAVDATEQTVTSPAFTPTGKGVVEVRLVSSSTSLTSVTYFDILASP